MSDGDAMTFGGAIAVPATPVVDVVIGGSLDDDGVWTAKLGAGRSLFKILSVDALAIGNTNFDIGLEFNVTAGPVAGSVAGAFKPTNMYDNFVSVISTLNQGIDDWLREVTRDLAFD